MICDGRERSWIFSVQFSVTNVTLCGLSLTIVGIKIENDIRSFNFAYEISVQYIYFLVLFVKMSEQVTLATVRELLETQERTFKYTKNFKDDINEIKRTVDDLKTSLNFSQKDIDDIKSRIYKAEERIMEAEEGIHDAQADVDHSLDQQEYLENQSRRNNVKVFGIPEKDAKEGLESWEEKEQLVKNEIKSNLKIEVDLNIERAHRVGKLRPQPSHRHDGSKAKVRPRPIIVRFQ